MGEAYANYSFAAHVTEVEVDTETGEVKVLRITPAYDVGFAINPALIESQIHGGIAQGLGFAIMEDIIIQDGIVRNPNFMDYLMPTSMDMPEIEKPILIEKAYKWGPFGAKGIGEPPLIAMPASIANAVADAIGIRIGIYQSIPNGFLWQSRKPVGRGHDVEHGASCCENSLSPESDRWRE